MPVFDWSALPLTCGLDHVRSLVGDVSDAAIYRMVKARKLPPPIFTHPMRWSRIDLEREWSGESTALTSRKRRPA